MSSFYARGTVDQVQVTSGTLSAATETVDIANLGNASHALVHFVNEAGGFDGTVYFEGTADGTHWASLQAFAKDTLQLLQAYVFGGSNGALFSVPVGGLLGFRVRLDNFAARSGSVDVILRATYDANAELVYDLKPSQNVIVTSLPSVKIRDTSNVAIIQATAAPASDAAGLVMRAVQAGCSASSGVASSSGNNTVLTPAGGNKLRIFYLSYNPANDCECAFRFGAAGSLFLRNSLVAGSVVAKDFGDVRYLEGATDESLILNLSSAVSTVWNVFYVETT